LERDVSEKIGIHCAGSFSGGTVVRPKRKAVAASAAAPHALPRQHCRVEPGDDDFFVTAVLARPVPSRM